ncbi:MAG: hypothetical protein ACKVQC_09080, partial [Elusimicrobiota bacterium]
ERFSADLHVLSHVSYAHMPLLGENKLKNWRETLSTGWAVLGNRGPRGGVHDPNSITNRIHPPHDRWNGYIVYQDNHAKLVETFPNVTQVDEQGNTVTEAAITFTKAVINGRPEFQHD